jgi:hypothetical protein
MPLIILTFIVQCCFVYHVFKTGRPAWWAYVILGAPVVGCIAYYFLEIFPGSREHRVANRTTRDIARALNPDKDLKRCLEAVETAPTVENKVALAQDWLRCGRAQEAIDLYRGAKTGPHANDPDLALSQTRKIPRQRCRAAPRASAGGTGRRHLCPGRVRAPRRHGGRPGSEDSVRSAPETARPRDASAKRIRGRPRACQALQREARRRTSVGQRGEERAGAVPFALSTPSPHPSPVPPREREAFRPRGRKQRTLIVNGPNPLASRETAE